uniref:Vascular cell adhesion molecule 1 n=1 Tax=Pelodiscus sinensis TaxID=13735 RepID=K7FW43_PELSI
MSFLAFFIVQHLQKFRQMGRIIPSATVLLLVFVTSNAFEIHLTPEHKVAVQLGKKLELICHSRDCESPEFSWRTQFDNPLGGTTNNTRSSSVLTMDPVDLKNEHEYVCSATCDNVKKEKNIKVDVYSFSSDPVIEFSTPLYVGEKASITCIVHRVYPSDRLEMQLEKDGSVLAKKDFSAEEITETTEIKSLTWTFIPTFEDIGKEITCVAELPIDDMEFEPKKRHISQRLSVNFGPQNTNITVSPSNTVTQGETLMLTCRTTSNPSARIVWRKELSDSSVQHIIDNETLIIPHTLMSDSGLFICEAINDAMNKTERTTVVISVQGMSLQDSDVAGLMKHNISVSCGEAPASSWNSLQDQSLTASIQIRKPKQMGLINTLTTHYYFANYFSFNRKSFLFFSAAAPRITEFSIQPSTAVEEGDNVTILCSVESNPAARIVLRRKSDSEDTVLYSEHGIVHIPSVTFLHAGTYECEAKNALGESKMAAALNGPRNTTVSVTPSNSVKEGEAVTMTCSSNGNPSPEISWAKQLTNGKSQFLSKDATLTINNVKADDWGLYECVGVNQFGREKKTVELIVQVPSQNTAELIYPSDNVDEGENATIMSTTSSNPLPQISLPKVQSSNTTILSSQNGSSTLYSDTENYTSTYLIAIDNEAGNNTDVIDTVVIAIVKKKDYIIPVIVVLSCLSAMAVPALSILVYVSRKAKINGSYSIVNAPKPCV